MPNDQTQTTERPGDPKVYLGEIQPGVIKLIIYNQVGVILRGEQLIFGGPFGWPKMANLESPK